MLRFFRQYYPIRNIFFVIGEGVFIYISVLLAAVVIMGHLGPARAALVLPEAALHHGRLPALPLLQRALRPEGRGQPQGAHDPAGPVAGGSRHPAGLRLHRLPRDDPAHGHLHRGRGDRAYTDRGLAVRLRAGAQPGHVQPAHHPARLRGSDQENPQRGQRAQGLRIHGRGGSPRVHRRRGSGAARGGPHDLPPPVRRALRALPRAGDRENRGELQGKAQPLPREGTAALPGRGDRSHRRQQFLRDADGQAPGRADQPELAHLSRAVSRSRACAGSSSARPTSSSPPC